MEIAALALLHVLVFVYWLGGDLGVFYSSTLLTDAKRAPAARLAAAQVLAQVDMAPRTALILAAPTGYALAVAKGWWAGELWTVVAAFAGSLAWLALAWTIHQKHLPPASPWRRLDLGLRWLVVLKLAALAAGLNPFGFAPDLPVFLKAKMALLAACVLCGLAVRRAMAPFGPAFAALASGAPTPESDATIAACLARARPWVVTIWVLIALAAFLGLWAGG